MKHILIGLICCLFTVACSPQSQSNNSDMEKRTKEEITQAFDALAFAAENLDFDSYFSLFDDKTFTALNSNGTTCDSFNEFQSTYLPQFKTIHKYNSLEFGRVIINVIDSENAVLINEYSAEIVLESGDIVSANGAGAQFWSKRTGNWKLVHVSDVSQ